MDGPTSIPRTGRVLLVRHGETSWSRAGRHTGSTDLSLTEEGIASLAPLRARLAAGGFARVLTSPLKRARQTCEVLGWDADAEVVEDLAEWRYGDYEGWTPEQIQAERPGWDLWRDGAPGGEAPDEVGRRIDRVVADLQTDPDSERRVLVVAHGHSLRTLGARWVGLAVEAGRHLRLSPGHVGQLGWHRAIPVISSWNIP